MAAKLMHSAENRLAQVEGGHGEEMDDFVLDMPADATRLDGFRAWTLSDEFPEHGRITFISGRVFFDMSREEISTHMAVKTQIGKVFEQICDDESIGMTMVDGCYVVNEKAEVANIPDIVYVSFRAIELGRVSLTPRKRRPDQKVELVGSPDVVVEIVSDSSVEKDVRRLRKAYHAAEIPEYWLIDARGDEVAFQILMHRRPGYVASPNRDGWIRSRVFDREFRLVRAKNRVGIWKYRLETRTK